MCLHGHLYQDNSVQTQVWKRSTHFFKSFWMLLSWDSPLFPPHGWTKFSGVLCPTRAFPMPLYLLIQLVISKAGASSPRLKTLLARDLPSLSCQSRWGNATKRRSCPCSSLVHLPTVYHLLAAGTPPIPSTPFSLLTSGIPSIIFSRLEAWHVKKKRARGMDFKQLLLFGPAKIPQAENSRRLAT